MSEHLRGRSVLIVSFSYAPVANARALRWTALAEDWARRGLRVSVVCGWSPGAPHRETLNGVQVHRVGAKATEVLRAHLARNRGGESARQQPQDDRQRKSMLACLTGFFARHVWRNLYWPDTTCVWYFSAAREAKRIARESPTDAVVSVSPTFTSVLVARAVRRSLKTRARWLIDLGDPFSIQEGAPPNNARLYRRLNLRVERRVFELASAVTLTTEPTCALYAGAFPASASKLHVIPPLVSLPPVPVPFPQPDDGQIRLVFVGTLYGGIRRPDFLLRLVERLLASDLGSKLEMHFYGDTHACAQTFRRYGPRLGSRLVLHGPVPRLAALQALRSATVLVNIGNATAHQLPSKVIEYAATGKPILNIGVIEADLSAAVLEDYPGRLCLNGQNGEPTEAQVAATLDFLRHMPPNASPEWLRAWLRPYALETISRQYLSLLFPHENSSK